ncbi:MAG: hypothetical protein LBG46_02805 [Elusimicrobiota bacterium]|jgi:hypothetical protein|nr:hypothetical protein [Elusimicrobiota bacterium]
MIAIFDIDGVLADNAETKNLDCRKPDQHAEFARRITGVSALPMARFAQAIAYCGAPFFIFTARSEALRMPTEEWLEDTIGTVGKAGMYDGLLSDEQNKDFVYSSNRLYMRPLGNNDEAHLLKWKQLQGLLAILKETEFNYSNILVFEDNARSAKMFAQNGCRVYRPFEFRAK